MTIYKPFYSKKEKVINSISTKLTMITIFQTIIIGVVLNLFLIGLYFFLHKQIEKYESVGEKIIKSAKRARRSYFLSYFIVLVLIALIFFIPTLLKWALSFLVLVLIIILEIVHDSQRLVLTKNQITIIKGFFACTATMVEYRHIEIVEVQEDIMGKILGYGNLNIRTEGTKGYSFKKIPKVLELKSIIEKKKLTK